MNLAEVVAMVMVLKEKIAHLDEREQVVHDGEDFFPTWRRECRSLKNTSKSPRTIRHRLQQQPSVLDQLRGSFQKTTRTTRRYFAP